MENTIKKLQTELQDAKDRLNEKERESIDLRKAIWDMLNYSNLYIIALDHNMIIKLINWKLATDLGFEEETDVLNKCWLDFIPEIETKSIKSIHRALAMGTKEDHYKYREITNDIITVKKEIITVKWFNIPINSKYNITFSSGLKVEEPFERPNLQAEDSIRSYYRDIIKKDKTMIDSLRDVVIKGVDCKIEE